jgi:peroxiredoxin Q/BCP
MITKIKGINEKGQEQEYNLNELINHKGQDTILYFYPKDDTPGCTIEANDFNNSLNKLTEKARVIGVSPDGIESHKKFQEKYGLNFTLLSDPNHELAEEYGAWGEKAMYGKNYMGINRSTFLLNDEGQIKKSWKNVRVKGHVDEVMESLN